MGEGIEEEGSADRRNTMLFQVGSPEPGNQNGMMSPHGNAGSLDQLYQQSSASSSKNQLSSANKNENNLIQIVESDIINEETPREEGYNGSHMSN